NRVNRFGLERLGDKPLIETPDFIKKLRSYVNIGKILLNRAMRICRSLNPNKWRISAGFLTTLAVCTLVLLAAYLVKNGSLGEIRSSGRSSSAKKVVTSTWGSSRTDYSTSQTTYQSWETGNSPNSLGEHLRPSWLDLSIIFKPGDILYDVITRAVAYKYAPPGPPKMQGEMSIFNQKMLSTWNQLKEQIRLADEFARNHLATAALKTRVGTLGDSSATTTVSNSDTADGTVDGSVEGAPDGSVEGTPDESVEGTPGNQQGNDSSPTSTTPSQGTGSSSNPGESPSANTTDQNGSATP
ncbi:MAG: hypothetical protein IID46_14970, partial [Planctomycetes bacterium]|nr:hypothetical protein [Planctomycetota bacterium]